jgi:hypothetical protein
MVRLIICCQWYCHRTPVFDDVDDESTKLGVLMTEATQNDELRVET